MSQPRYGICNVCIRFAALIIAMPIPVSAAGLQYNVRDYGASGDKTSNDRAAIQAAVDACYGDGGGTVILPSGDYVTSSGVSET